MLMATKFYREDQQHCALGDYERYGHNAEWPNDPDPVGTTVESATAQ